MNSQEIYIKRINRAIDYIERNLENKILLEDISGEIFFSKYHFHRIFKAFTGESLYAYVNRLRVERAAYYMATIKLSVTEIAFKVGFSDISTFSRAFKKRFNLSPSAWRKNNSKINQEFLSKPLYNSSIGNPEPGGVQPFDIKIERLSVKNLLYLRNFGAFKGDFGIFRKIHKKLLKILNESGLNWRRDWGYIVVYHDSLGITDDENLKISYGILTDEGNNYPEDLGHLDLGEKYYLNASFLLKENEYGSAWTVVYRSILPALGYEPVDGLSFENYFDNCYTADTGLTKVRIFIPVKKM